MIKEILITNPIEKEIQPDGSSVDIIDCYDGCQIQCPYCFQLNNPSWSKDIFVRNNLPILLKDYLKNKPNGELFIGSLSDPYMDIEKEYKLTRKCLQVLSQSELDIRITTKANNELLLRDIDVLKSFKNPPRILLGLSHINSANKGANNINIKVANELKRQGIDVWVFITPILPYIMDLDAMITAIDKDIPMYLDKLRVMKKGHQDAKIFQWIQRNFPQYINEYSKILFKNNEEYYKSIVKKYSNDKRITFMFELWGV